MTQQAIQVRPTVFFRTVAEVREAIKSAKIIFVTPRIGSTDFWVKIPKYEAEMMFDKTQFEGTETAADLEMGTDYIAHADGPNALYIG